MTDRATVQFPCLIIAADPERAEVLRETAILSGVLVPVVVFERYPAERELASALSRHSIDVAVLDLADLPQATVCLDLLKQFEHRCGLVGIGVRTVGHEFPGLASYPPAPDELSQAVQSAVRSARPITQASIHTFLPAKAGCGASTIIMNTAGALARQGRKVLVIDTDMYSGVLGLMTGVSTGSSIQTLLRGMAEADRFRLNQAIGATHGFGVLCSDGTWVSPRPGWEDYFRLLDLARDRFDTILIDMPEAVNAGTRELLLRSNSVFLVTTQEPVCLHLALRRLGELIDADVPKTAIRLILNRCQRGEMEYTDVETLLGTPVFHPIPNDYRAVRRAFLASGLIAGNTALGRSFEDLASKLCGGDAHKKTGLASTLGGLFGARGASKPSETGPRTA